MAKEVANARRKQHLSSLQYYCALNALQYRKRVAMMEPMLGYTRGQVWTVTCLYHFDMCLRKVKHHLSGVFLRFFGLVFFFWELANDKGGAGGNFCSACLLSNKWFCLQQLVEHLDIQERQQWKKSYILIYKASQGLIFFAAKLSVQQHLLTLFTLVCTNSPMKQFPSWHIMFSILMRSVHDREQSMHWRTGRTEQ